MASAGVARLGNGRLGNVDHCQVGVFATLCRGEMASLIDTRLDLPKAWAEDAARCRKAAIPKDARCSRSKTDLAPGMIETALARGVRFGTGWTGATNPGQACVVADKPSMRACTSPARVVS